MIDKRIASHYNAGFPMKLYRPALPTVMAAAYFACEPTAIDLRSDRDPRSPAAIDGKIEKTQGGSAIQTPQTTTGLAPIYL